MGYSPTRCRSQVDSSKSSTTKTLLHLCTAMNTKSCHKTSPQLTRRAELSKDVSIKNGTTACGFRSFPRIGRLYLFANNCYRLDDPFAFLWIAWTQLFHWSSSAGSREKNTVMAPQHVSDLCRREKRILRPLSVRILGRFPKDSRRTLCRETRFHQWFPHIYRVQKWTFAGILWKTR